MDSHQTLSGGGGGTDPSSAASAQPGSAATALFPYPEHELPGLLGRPADKIAAVRKTLVQGVDWSRVSRQFRWSEAGLKKAAATLGSPAIASDVKKAAEMLPPEKSAPTGQPAPRAAATLTVFNLNIPNKKLVLCRDAAGKAVAVGINPAWRAKFRHGMKIEAEQGAGGQWRTRCPRFVGKF